MNKENEAINDKIIRDIKTLFKEEDDYYKPIRSGNLWNSNYIEYQSNGDRNKPSKHLLVLKTSATRLQCNKFSSSKAS